MEERIYELIKTKVPSGKVLKNEPMSAYTTFKTGGLADCMVIPAYDEELSSILLLAKAEQIPYYVIGNGSNMLVSDDGYHGIIILIKDLHAEVSFTEETEGTLATVSAGCPLTRLAMEAAKRSLTGLEFAAGIPGTVGGAVVMNAGAYGGEIKDCLESVLVMNKTGEKYELPAQELNLSYRHSIIPEQELIVLRASFRLQQGNTDEIMATIADLNGRRRDKQPLEYPSAGSTFKRPEGYFAGKLIEDSGLKGFSVGGACVSEKHCGFVVNKGGATSSDIMALIGQVVLKVHNDTGVQLEPEVRFLGFDAEYL